MTQGWIRDYGGETDGADRAAFTTPFFTTRTGSLTHGDLAWGAVVEIDDAADDGTGRVPVAHDGQDGFVGRSHVVAVKFVDRFQEDGAWRYDVPLFTSETSNKRKVNLLWGDTAQVLRVGDERSRVRCRGLFGWVDNDHLGDESLLEMYFVDVGQGDGVLIRTPDRRHLLLDGGFLRLRQPTRKSVADFVDWKFFEDYGDFRVRLDELIVSHPDLDHYGGLDDLLSQAVAAKAELDCVGVDVGAFYHPGVSWWRPTDEEIADFGLTGDRKKRWLGPVEANRLTRLLGDHDDASAAVDGGPHRLQGMWGDFVERVVGATASIERLGVRSTQVDEDVFLPGYAIGEASPCEIRVLAPVTYRSGGKDTVIDFASESQNTNGHSIVLRLDYGHCRVLMTGDLNKNSMQALAQAYGDEMRKFGCDVAKACHHGSEDVSYSFLEKLAPAATIISSGDAEGHAHPRAAIVGASGLTGHKEIDATNDELLTPLVYSTEIERSLRLGRNDRIQVERFPQNGALASLNVFAQPSSQFDDDLKVQAEEQEAAETSGRFHYREAKPGAFRPKRGDRDFQDSFVVAGVVYGLVNVRTNGDQVMCATMREDGGGWTVRSFTARH